MAKSSNHKSIQKENNPSTVQSVQLFWKKLGPGLVTGASDDDPSGITTYSQAGAQFGTQLLWTAVVTYPLMVSIQEMCARIGLVTRKGLTGVIRQKYPKPVLYVLLALSFPSIVLNIGADIAGMGAVANLLVPQIPSFLFSILFTGILMYSIVFWSYRKISTVLKWLCITLFCYLVIPFLVRTDWLDVIRHTFVPDIITSRDYFFALVGILGTTISPYLFFWQANMEVEEVKHRHVVVDKHLITDMQTDVKGGLFLTNIVFFFIILTTGTVLFSSGIHNIETVEEAAKALQPLAGDFAYALFAMGVLGTGFLAIPVLAGSLSYMIAETFGWKEGLDKKFHQAKGFYVAMLVSLLVGLLIHFLELSPVKALLYTAILYGITAPFLIGVVIHICNSKDIMGEYTNGVWSNFLGIATMLLMLVSAAALLFL